MNFIQHGYLVEIDCCEQDRGWLRQISKTPYKTRNFLMKKTDYKTHYLIRNKNQKFISYGTWTMLKTILDTERVDYTFRALSPFKQLVNGPKEEQTEDFEGSVHSSPIIPLNLRDYQQQAHDQAVKNFTGILNMAVNAGKTELMTGIIQSTKIFPALVLVHSKVLLYQHADNIGRYLPWKIGLVGDGKLNLDQPITIGINKSVVNNLHKFKTPPKLILVDECHKHICESSDKILAKFQGARVYGFSGTPFKAKSEKKKTEADIQKLKCIQRFGPEIAWTTTEQLKDNGYTAQGDCVFFELSEDHTPRGDLRFIKNEDLLRHRVWIESNSERNVLAANLTLDFVKNQKLVVFISVKLKSHIMRMKHLLSKKFSEDEVLVLTGGTAKKTMPIIHERIKTGTLKIVLATSVINSGLSIKEMDVLINLAGGLSNFESIQRLGRVLRARDDKRFIYVDFIDSAQEGLLRHSKCRFNDIKRELSDTPLVYPTSSYKQALNRLSSRRVNEDHSLD